jgi:arsenate reductase
VHNAGRSQMAAAFFNAGKRQGDVAISAGTQPAERVHPEVVEIMKEVGIDLSEAKPQLLTEQLARDADLLITMGCGDKCPFIPGLKVEDWPLPDPKDRPPDEVRKIRDEVRDRVKGLIDGVG